jgi:benzylsuccinate CoA-transferase BbsF subunit
MTTAAATGPTSKKIFTGLKVADFTWAAAGPIVTKQLADNGATVIKVESRRHPDSVRLGGPFADDKPGINRSGFFADFNSSKLGMALDMGHPRAAEVVEPLVRWADVVAESFRPGVMAGWGFGYERLREMNPRIIMMSSSLYGAGGPWSGHPGFGAQGQALAGIHGLTGWPDRPPAMPKGAYTDSVSPRYAAAALIAALIHRDRTGEGQMLELSQIEATVNFLAPQLLDLQLTGRCAQRQGNADDRALLHGVFPCQGDDRWIAIEVWDEPTWDSCLRVLSGDEPAEPVLTAAADARRAQREEVEQAVARLTGKRDPFELMDALRAAGVPAGVTLTGSDLLEDEALRGRGHFWRLSHPEMGEVGYNGPAYRFERTSSELTKAAPCLGEDTAWVLGELLGFSSAQIGDLRESGMLE